MAMLPALMLALALGPTPLAAQSESLRAAAKLTGLTTGMAQACELDPAPVLHAFRDLMDRKKVQGARRGHLVKLVTAASDQGAATQRQPGAMSCTEVRGQIRRTTRRLRRAK